MTTLVQSELVKSEIRASFPYLIEIWKQTDTGKVNCYRYANSSSNIEFEGKTFLAGYFKPTPPERTDSGIKDAKIAISSIDQEWIEKIRKTESTDMYLIRFVASIVRYDDDNKEYVEALDDITYKLTNANWNETTIEWTMKFDEWQDIKVPCQKLAQFVCPALF